MRVLKKEILEEIYNLALPKAKDDFQHEHYYSFKENKIISLNKGEVEDYLLNCEVYDDEFDELLEDIIDSTDYVKIPSYDGNDEEFKRNLYFAIDYSEIGFIEADSELAKSVYEMAHQIYKLQPFKYFNDFEFIVDDPKIRSLDKCYICVLGKAEKCYGVSFYFGDEGLGYLANILDEETIRNHQENLFFFSQKSLTIYFDKPAKDSDAYFKTKELLGEKAADEISISMVQTNGHLLFNNFLRHGISFYIRPFMESFIFFIRRYIEDENSAPHRKLKRNEHYVYHFNEDSDLITYRIQRIELPTFPISEEFVYSVPFIYNKGKLKKTSREYEFKLFSMDRTFASALDYRILSYPVVASLINHKTGDIVAANIVSSEESWYLEALFAPLIEKIREIGLPKKIYVDTILDFFVAQRLFDDQKIVEIETILHTRDFVKYLLEQDSKDNSDA